MEGGLEGEGPRGRLTPASPGRGSRGPDRWRHAAPTPGSGSEPTGLSTQNQAAQIPGAVPPARAPDLCPAGPEGPWLRQVQCPLHPQGHRAVPAASPWRPKDSDLSPRLQGASRSDPEGRSPWRTQDAAVTRGRTETLPATQVPLLGAGGLRGCGAGVGVREGAGMEGGGHRGTVTMPCSTSTSEAGCH